MTRMMRNLYCDILTSLGIILMSCALSSKGYAESYAIDTTLNAKLLLWHRSDVSKSHLKNIVGEANFVYEESMTYEDTIHDNIASRVLGGDLYPYVLLYNRDKTEFAIASPYYGTCHQCWQCFYIGLLSKEAIEKEKHRIVNTKESHFFTESGIHLLMSKDEVITLKGEPDVQQDSLMTYYYISSDIPMDSEEYNYYKEHNIGNMFLTVIIQKDKVIGIAYGYVEI